MSDKEDFNCSDLTDVSERGLVEWADKNGLFEPAVEEPIDLQPPQDPCDEMGGYIVHDGPVDDYPDRGPNAGINSCLRLKE